MSDLRRSYIEEVDDENGPEETGSGSENNTNEAEDNESKESVEQNTASEVKLQYSKDQAWSKVQRYLVKNNVRGAAVVGKRSVMYPSLIEDFTCIVHLQVKRNLFIVKIRYPVAVPEAKRVPITLELAKINFSMLIGSFQIDMSDGELTFFHANAIGTRLKESVIGRNVGISKMTVHQYAQQIGRFIFTEQQPQQQQQQRERQQSEDNSSEGSASVLEQLLAAMGRQG